MNAVTMAIGKRFACFFDICTEGLQFCFSDQRRCRYCSDFSQNCFTNQQELNCTRYCMERWIEQQEMNCADDNHNGEIAGLVIGWVLVIILLIVNISCMVRKKWHICKLPLWLENFICCTHRQQNTTNTRQQPRQYVRVSSIEDRGTGEGTDTPQTNRTEHTHRPGRGARVPGPPNGASLTTSDGVVPDNITAQARVHRPCNENDPNSTAHSNGIISASHVYIHDTENSLNSTSQSYDNILANHINSPSTGNDPNNAAKSTGNIPTTHLHSSSTRNSLNRQTQSNGSIPTRHHGENCRNSARERIQRNGQIDNEQNMARRELSSFDSSNNQNALSYNTISTDTGYATAGPSVDRTLLKQRNATSNSTSDANRIDEVDEEECEGMNKNSIKPSEKAERERERVSKEPESLSISSLNS